MIKTLLTSAVAVLALAATGCGGSSSSSDTTTTASPTDEWAAGFCTAVTTWTDSIKSVGDELKNPSSLSQDGLQSAADDVKSATTQFADDVKGLGAPDTESGEEIKTSLDELSTTLETESADIETAAQGVSSVTDLPGAITTVSKSLSAMGTSFSSTLSTIQNADAKGELQTALQDSPECASISS